MCIAREPVTSGHLHSADVAFRSVVVGFSAAADGRQFVVDRETVLVGACFGTKGLVSYSPTDTFANTVTSNAVQFSADVILLGNSIGQQMSGLAFKFQKGDVIFCCASAAGSYQLFFSDPE